MEERLPMSDSKGVYKASVHQKSSGATTSKSTRLKSERRASMPSRVPQEVTCFPPESAAECKPAANAEEEDRLTEIIEFASKNRHTLGERDKYRTHIQHIQDDVSLLTFDETLDNISASGKSALWNRSSQQPKKSKEYESLIDAQSKKKLPIPMNDYGKLWRPIIVCGACAFIIVTARNNYNFIQHQKISLEKDHVSKLRQEDTNQFERERHKAIQRKSLNTTQYQLQPESVMEYSPGHKKSLLEPKDETKASIATVAAPSESLPTTETSEPKSSEVPKISYAPPPTRDPRDLLGYKDVWEPHDSSDLPVVWHIPKSGALIIKDIMVTCHRMTMASDAKVIEGLLEENKISVVRIGGDAAKGEVASRFVNVDTTTSTGLKRAKALGLAQSGKVDAIYTPLIFEADILFDPDHQGRLFTIFRHPVERAKSMFKYLQYAHWAPGYTPKLASMSLEDYAESGLPENNVLTRTLVNKTTADLSDGDVQVAMDVIRRKILVGLLNKKEESMERFEKYFGWKYSIHPKNQEKCRTRLLATMPGDLKEPLKPGMPAYDMLASVNHYDMQLYEYVETLFVEQAAFVDGIPDGFRMNDAACCKCQTPPSC